MYNNQEISYFGQFLVVCHLFLWPCVIQTKCYYMYRLFTRRQKVLIFRCVLIFNEGVVCYLSFAAILTFHWVFILKCMTC